MRFVVQICVVAILGYQLITDNGVYGSEECRAKLDLVIILDSSLSVGLRNFKRVTTFIQSLIGFLPVQPDGVRVSLVRYATDAKVISFFDQDMSKSEKITSVKTMAYSVGSTYTHLALQLTRESVLVPERGDRPDVPNLIIVTTDGVSRSQTKTQNEAAILKRNSDLKIFVIGIGKDVADAELVNMASRPEMVYKLTDFTQLTNIVGKIATFSCSDMKESSISELTNWSGSSVSFNPSVGTNKSVSATISSLPSTTRSSSQFLSTTVSLSALTTTTKSLSSQSLSTRTPSLSPSTRSSSQSPSTTASLSSSTTRSSSQSPSTTASLSSSTTRSSSQSPSTTASLSSSTTRSSSQSPSTTASLASSTTRSSLQSPSTTASLASSTTRSSSQSPSTTASLSSSTTRSSSQSPSTTASLSSSTTRSSSQFPSTTVLLSCLSTTTKSSSQSPSTTASLSSSTTTMTSSQSPSTTASLASPTTTTSSLSPSTRKSSLSPSTTASLSSTATTISSSSLSPTTTTSSSSPSPSSRKSSASPSATTSSLSQSPSTTLSWRSVSVPLTRQTTLGQRLSQTITRSTIKVLTKDATISSTAKVNQNFDTTNFPSLLPVVGKHNRNFYISVASLGLTMSENPTTTRPTSTELSQFQTHKQDQFETGSQDRFKTAAEEMTDVTSPESDKANTYSITKQFLTTNSYQSSVIPDSITNGTLLSRKTTFAGIHIESSKLENLTSSTYPTLLTNETSATENHTRVVDNYTSTLDNEHTSLINGSSTMSPVLVDHTPTEEVWTLQEKTRTTITQEINSIPTSVNNYKILDVSQLTVTESIHVNIQTVNSSNSTMLNKYETMDIELDLNSTNHGNHSIHGENGGDLSSRDLYIFVAGGSALFIILATVGTCMSVLCRKWMNKGAGNGNV